MENSCGDIGSSVDIDNIGDTGDTGDIGDTSDRRDLRKTSKEAGIELYDLLVPFLPL